MPFTIDPEIAAGLAPLLAMAEGVEPPAAGDWQTRRTTIEALMVTLADAQPTPADVSTTDYETTAEDGTAIHMRWYTKDEAPPPGSAALYIHGGGMILGTMDLYDATVKRYVAASGVPMLSVDYRVAPEHPHPVPVEDSYAGLTWLAEHAAELGVDPDRIAVMGDSAGGGIAAGVALMTRDRGGPRLLRQILIYPMLDDRTTEVDADIAPFATWTYDDNITGWGALLGDAAGSDDVSHYAAPARAQDLTGLAPAYIDVGELDAFRNEDIAYARRLAAAGVSIELHVHPGCPHGFEGFAPTADVSRRALSDRHRALQSL